jgi:hypothetical protein
MSSESETDESLDEMLEKLVPERKSNGPQHHWALEMFIGVLKMAAIIVTAGMALALIDF